VHDDHVERVLAVTGTLNHLLEHGSSIVRGGGAGLDELCRHCVSMTAAPRFQLLSLVGDRQIMLSLPACRDTHIEGRPRLGRGHLRSCNRFVRLHGRPPAFAGVIVAAIGVGAKAFSDLLLLLQQVVEQRAEIGLEDVKFALGHGHNCWKIVDNLRVVTRSAARAVLELALLARTIVGRATMIVLNDPSCRS
jgi:hypothetical protein